MRAILFDFGGTLDYPRHWLDRFLTHYREAGVELTRSELDAAFDKATHIAYRDASSIREFGLSSLVHYLVKVQLEELALNGSGRVRAVLDKAVARQVDSPRNGIGRLADRISRAFVEESIAGLRASREILTALRTRFKIGVVSNFYGNLDRILAEAGFGELVDALADSSRLGIFKPDPGIFQAALDQLGVAAGEAVMVGDSLDKDCVPARRLGCSTVWLRHREASGSDSEGLADFTIGSLAELKDLIWPA
jgi:HAD superfamily hydrolase (TIGR01509 family)